MSLFALDKWARAFRIIRQHGGFVPAMLKLWRMDTLKDGKYMGRDCMENKYYENKNYILGRSRWVEYRPNVRFEYDATMMANDHGPEFTRRFLSFPSVTLEFNSQPTKNLSVVGETYNKALQIYSRLAAPSGSPRLVSKISPEWYGWLHYKTDRLPCEDWAKYCLACDPWAQVWMLPPEENLSGTNQAYVPYNTCTPRIIPWDGHSLCNRPCVPVE